MTANVPFLWAEPALVRPYAIAQSLSCREVLAQLVGPHCLALL